MNKVKQGKGRIFDIGAERGRHRGPKAIYSREEALLERNGLTRVPTNKWVTADNGQKFRVYEWVP